MNIALVLKSVIAVFFLMLHPVGVSASDWQSVEKVPSRLAWQIDVSSIKKIPNGNLTVWNKFVMEPATIERVHKNNPKYKNYSYSLSFWEIDCARKMYNVTTGIDYSSVGEISTIYNSNGQMGPIIPDSTSDAVAEYICNSVEVIY